MYHQGTRAPHYTNETSVLLPTATNMADFEDETVPSILLPCTACNRTFRPEALSKHVKYCEKSLMKKRKVFDSSKQRILGTDLAEFLPVLSHSKKKVEKSPVRKMQSKWKEKHMELVRAIRAARVGPSSEENLPPAPIKPSDHDQCPHCERFFGPKAYDRHLEWCKEHANRIQQKSPASILAKERLEARTKYRAPVMRSRRSITKEKYQPPGTRIRDFSPAETTQRNLANVSTSQKMSPKGGNTCSFDVSSRIQPNRSSKRNASTMKKLYSAVKSKNCDTNTNYNNNYGGGSNNVNSYITKNDLNRSFDVNKGATPTRTPHLEENLFSSTIQSKDTQKPKMKNISTNNNSVLSSDARGLVRKRRLIRKVKIPILNDINVNDDVAGMTVYACQAADTYPHTSDDSNCDINLENVLNRNNTHHNSTQVVPLYSSDSKEGPCIGVSADLLKQIDFDSYSFPSEKINGSLVGGPDQPLSSSTQIYLKKLDDLLKTEPGNISTSLDYKAMNDNSSFKDEPVNISMPLDYKDMNDNHNFQDKPLNKSTPLYYEDMNDNSNFKGEHVNILMPLDDKDMNDNRNFQDKPLNKSTPLYYEDMNDNSNFKGEPVNISMPLDYKDINDNRNFQDKPLNKSTPLNYEDMNDNSNFKGEPVNISMPLDYEDMNDNCNFQDKPLNKSTPLYYKDMNDDTSFQNVIECNIMLIDDYKSVASSDYNNNNNNNNNNNIKRQVNYPALGSNESKGNFKNNCIEINETVGADIYSTFKTTEKDKFVSASKTKMGSRELLIRNVSHKMLESTYSSRQSNSDNVHSESEVVRFDGSSLKNQHSTENYSVDSLNDTVSCQSTATKTSLLSCLSELFDGKPCIDTNIILKEDAFGSVQIPDQDGKLNEASVKEFSINAKNRISRYTDFSEPYELMVSLNEQNCLDCNTSVLTGTTCISTSKHFDGNNITTHSLDSLDKFAGKESCKRFGQKVFVCKPDLNANMVAEKNVLEDTTISELPGVSKQTSLKESFAITGSSASTGSCGTDILQELMPTSNGEKLELYESLMLNKISGSSITNVQDCNLVNEKCFNSSNTFSKSSIPSTSESKKYRDNWNSDTYSNTVNEKSKSTDVIIPKPNTLLNQTFVKEFENVCVSGHPNIEVSNTDYLLLMPNNECFVDSGLLMQNKVSSMSDELSDNDRLSTQHGDSLEKCLVTTNDSDAKVVNHSKDCKSCLDVIAEKSIASDVQNPKLNETLIQPSVKQLMAIESLVESGSSATTFSNMRESVLTLSEKNLLTNVSEHFDFNIVKKQSSESEDNFLELNCTTTFRCINDHSNTLCKPKRSNFSSDSLVPDERSVAESKHLCNSQFVNIENCNLVTKGESKQDGISLSQNKTLSRESCYSLDSLAVKEAVKGELTTDCKTGDNVHEGECGETLFGALSEQHSLMSERFLDKISNEFSLASGSLKSVTSDDDQNSLNEMVRPPSNKRRKYELPDENVPLQSTTEILFLPPWLRACNKYVNSVQNNNKNDSNNMSNEDVVDTTTGVTSNGVLVSTSSVYDKEDLDIGMCKDCQRSRSDSDLFTFYNKKLVRCCIERRTRMYRVKRVLDKLFDGDASTLTNYSDEVFSNNEIEGSCEDNVKERRSGNSTKLTRSKSLESNFNSEWEDVEDICLYNEEIDNNNFSVRSEGEYEKKIKNEVGNYYEHNNCRPRSKSTVNTLNWENTEECHESFVTGEKKTDSTNNIILEDTYDNTLTCKEFSYNEPEVINYNANVKEIHSSVSCKVTCDTGDVSDNLYVDNNNRECTSSKLNLADIESCNLDCKENNSEPACDTDQTLKRECGYDDCSPSKETSTPVTEKIGYSKNRCCMVEVLEACGQADSLKSETVFSDNKNNIIDNGNLNKELFLDERETISQEVLQGFRVYNCVESDETSKSDDSAEYCSSSLSQEGVQNVHQDYSKQNDCLINTDNNFTGLNDKEAEQGSDDKNAEKCDDSSSNKMNSFKIQKCVKKFISPIEQYEDYDVLYNINSSSPSDFKNFLHPRAFNNFFDENSIDIDQDFKNLVSNKPFKKIQYQRMMTEECYVSYVTETDTVTALSTKSYDQEELKQNENCSVKRTTLPPLKLKQPVKLPSKELLSDIKEKLHSKTGSFFNDEKSVQEANSYKTGMLTNWKLEAKKNISLPPIVKKSELCDENEINIDVSSSQSVKLPVLVLKSENSITNNHRKFHPPECSLDNYDPFKCAERQMKELLGLSENDVINDIHLSNFEHNEKSKIKPFPVSLSSLTLPTSAFAKFTPIEPVVHSEGQDDVVPPPSKFDNIKSKSPEIESVENKCIKDRNENPISLSTLSLCSTISIESFESSKHGLRKCISNSAKDQNCDQKSVQLPLKRSISAVESHRKGRDLLKGNLKMENLLFGFSEDNNYNRYLGTPVSDINFDSNSSFENLTLSNESLKKSDSTEESRAERELIQSMYEFEKLFETPLKPLPPLIPSTSPGPIAQIHGDTNEEFKEQIQPQSSGNKFSTDSAYNSLNRKSPQSEDNAYIGKYSPGRSETSCTLSSGQNSQAAKFCHECGAEFPVFSAKFCCHCGVRRLVI